MDADPLYHIKQLFYQASYKACIDEASNSDAGPSALYYAARSHLALTPPNTVAAQSILSNTSTPAAKAIVVLSEYLSVGEGDRSAKVDEIRDLIIEAESAEGEGEVEEGQGSQEGLIRVIGGTVFILEGEVEEAVATLTEGKGKEDLECMALLIQLLISIHRRDLAQSIYTQAKKVGNDSTLVQAMEAWIGLKTGARPLHQAYYYYEEVYQMPAGRTGPVLASHAAAHFLLGHVDEAKADINEALAKGNGDTNGDVLAVGASLRMDGLAQKLATATPSHPFAKDLEAKSSAFDEAAAKFGITA